MITTVRRGAPPAFDDGPVRRRLGLIALATDLTVEADAHGLTGDGEFGLYVTRVAFDNPVTDASLRAMAPGERLDAIAFACTSASAAIGDDAVRAAIAAERPDTPVVTPTTGLLRATRALGVRRLAVLAPYAEPVARALADYLERLSLEVTALTWLGVDDDRAIARITPATIEAAAERAMDPAADALFCACTALRAATLAPRLAGRLGRPVLTSNQVLWWDAVRRAGSERPLASAPFLP